MIPAQYNLLETGSRGYKVRTKKNVVDSDATLILTPGRELTGDSLLTRNYALDNGKPYLHLFPGYNWKAPIRGFFEDHWIRILNVAGPRDAASIEQFVCNVLDEVLLNCKIH